MKTSAWQPALMCTLALALVDTQPASAVDGTWTTRVDGAWSGTGNWAGNSLASGSGSTAALTGGGTVTINQDMPGLTLGAINFANGTYTINNNPITFSGGNAITVEAGATGTIQCALDGSSGLYKHGDGLLILAGTNTFSGTLTATNSGTLRLTGTLAANTLSFGSNGVTGGSLLIENPAAISNVANVFVRGGTITLAIDTQLVNGSNMSLGRVGWNDGRFDLVIDRATPGDGVNHVLGSLMPHDKGVVTVSSGTNTCGAMPVITFNRVTPFGAVNNSVPATITPTGVVLRLGDMYPITPAFGSYNQTVYLNGYSDGNEITGSISDTINGAMTNWVFLTKQNTSTWTLRGTNTYTGATTISNGRLVGATGGSCSNSAVTVDNAAGCLGIQITHTGKQWNCASLTFSAAGRLNFDFGASLTPGTTGAPLQVLGAAAFNSTPIVTIGGSTNLTAGSYPLMTWGSRSGTAPTNAILPPHIDGGLLTAGATNLTLTITANRQPLSWTNPAGGTWDLSSFNWKDSTGASAQYKETLAGGTMVVFDDTPGAGSATVTVNGAVSPGTVMANITNRSYTLKGAGCITGSAGLVKNGAGKFTISSTNSFTGGTVINSGTLEIGDSGVLYGGACRGTFTNNGAFVFGSSATQVFYGTVCGTGSVTCAGSGTLLFYVASTYTGDTLAYNGTIQINQPFLAPAANVHINSGARLNLNFVGTNSIRSLYINGHSVEKGTYGASGSGALVVRNDLFSGSGALKVTVGQPGTVMRVVRHHRNR